MLSIGKLAAGRENYYLELAAGQDDYYLDPAEPPGAWIGSLSPTLGLEGRVTAGKLRAVLAGCHPATGEQLLANPGRPGSVTGFDLTFSAPKSVSLLWALSDPDVAEAVAGCHDRAVVQAVQALEGEAVRARRGHAGAQVIGTSGLAAAAFGIALREPVTRSCTPMWSPPTSPSGRTASGHRCMAGPSTSGRKPPATSTRPPLRAELTENPRHHLGQVRKGMAEIAGITPAQTGAFSTRRAAVTAELERVGLTTPAAARTATLATRPAKDQAATLNELRQDWAARTHQIGLDPSGLVGPTRTPAVDPALTDRLAGPQGLTANATTFDRRAVLQALASGHPDGARPDQLRAVADMFLARPDVVALATPAPSFSTTELIGIERHAVHAAVARRDQRLSRVRPEHLEAALGARPP